MEVKTKKETKPICLKMVIAPAIKGQMEKQFRNLIGIIEKTTGFKIEVEESLTYLDSLKDLTSGKADMGWLGTHAFLEGAHDANIEAFAVGIRKKDHSSTYRTVFLARADSDINQLSDAKGKSLALTEKGSTSGDLMPKHELSKIGLNPNITSNFKKIVYSGSAESSITSIFSGSCDLAAISDVSYENIKGKGIIDNKELKVIHTSPAIPGAPLVYSKNLALDIRNKLKNAVLNAHKHGKVDGFGEDIIKYETQEEARLDFFKDYLRPQWGWKTFLSVGISILLISIITIHLKINIFEALGNTAKYLSDLLGRLLPPDFSNFWTLIVAMIETIEIGILGTVLAIFVGIPVGLFSAKNIAPNKPLYYLAKLITVFFRAIPEFVMAMIIVIAVGFGALPGILALGLHTMGFLAKFYAEEMEHVNTGPIEALKATGANKFQIIMFAIIPQVMPSFVGFSLYILDRNIRMATMLGIVGAGGIGYRLQSAFRMFQYREVSAIIIIIFVTIYLIDVISSKLRLSVK